MGNGGGKRGETLPHSVVDLPSAELRIDCTGSSLVVRANARSLL